jgi:hypothetical protein
VTAEGAPEATAPPVGPWLVQLRRIRWAVRAALTLGVAASVAANVLGAQPSVVGRAIAAWPPLALLLTVELISRVPVHRPGLARVRWTATAGIAGIAAWVSYWHMVAVALRYGETTASAHLIPLSVDGLVVVASVCLVELAGRIRATEDAEDAHVAVPGRAVAGKQPAAGAPAMPDAAVPAAGRTGASSRPRTGTRRAGRTGTRSDEELVAALAGVPREADGTVPIRRATAALGCGPDRARRLLATQGLLRTTTPPATTPSSSAPRAAA